MKKLLVAVAAALIVAPTAAAGGWTTIVPSGLPNIVDPAVLRTQAGTELVSFESPLADTISLTRNGGAPRVLVANNLAAGETQIVQQPDGTLQLYFPNEQGVARLTSTDDGQTWTGPTQTQSQDVGGVGAAAVLPDGTPLFVQVSSFSINVFKGLNGEAVRNIFPRCCGYAESLAVDSTGLAQIAFWSNANPPLANYLYATLGPDLTPSPPFVFSTGNETLSNDNRVPLVADGAGNTFAARLEGSPETKALWVDRFRGGKRVGSTRVWTAFTGQANRMALSLEPNGDLWAVWTAQGAVRAARSRSHGAHFGASVPLKLPSGAGPYQLEALARPGSVTAYLNTGSGLIASQKLLPGLAVARKRIGTKKNRHWIAIVTDDGVGVAGARVKGGKFTRKTDGKGRVSLAGLPHHLLMRITKAGYSSARFRVP